MMKTKLSLQIPIIYNKKILLLICEKNKKFKKFKNYRLFMMKILRHKYLNIDDEKLFFIINTRVVVT